MTHAFQDPFFVAGGSLDIDTPSYVERPADAELLAHIQAGELCYVLSARQMGKTSLMIRTSAKLREQGFKTALVDLESIGTAPQDVWYVSILTQLSHQLQIQTRVQDWWQNKSLLSAPQRFSEFLYDVVLRRVSGNIVLFIDEIDVMLRLDFRDDFFTAIRALYNARAKDALYGRLTFVLLGVATPIDLVRDPRRTPFNIGKPIELGEFNPRNVMPLLKGLEDRYPRQGAKLLRYIFDWTNGHPYLTQRVCLAIVKASKDIEWGEAHVEQIVTNCFLGEHAARDANLTFVRNSIASVLEDERQEMLAIYRAVYDGQPVADDESSLAQNHLELFGLVRVESAKLRIRNEIYRRVFDKEWIQSQLPKQQRSSWFIPIIIIVVIAFVIAGGFIGARAMGLLTSTPTLTAELNTSIPPTFEPTTEPTIASTIEPTVEPTVVPSIEPTIEPTAEPTVIPTTAPTAELTSTLPSVANCTVQPSGVTIRQSPSGISTGGGLAGGTQFSPETRSSKDNTFVWVKIPGSGWVYAGTSQDLVRCTGLDSVPLIENP